MVCTVFCMPATCAASPFKPFSPQSPCCFSPLPPPHAWPTPWHPPAPAAGPAASPCPAYSPCPTPPAGAAQVKGRRQGGRGLAVRRVGGMPPDPAPSTPAAEANSAAAGRRQGLGQQQLLQWQYMQGKSPQQLHHLRPRRPTNLQLRSARPLLRKLLLRRRQLPLALLHPRVCCTQPLLRLLCSSNKGSSR